MEGKQLQVTWMGLKAKHISLGSIVTPQCTKSHLWQEEQQFWCIYCSLWHKEKQIFSTAHTQPHTCLLARLPDHTELPKQRSQSSGMVLVSIWQIYRVIFFLQALLQCVHQLPGEMLCFAFWLLNASLYSPACLPSLSFVAGQIPCARVSQLILLFL